jgi:2-polyprenyl-3-methyl-5-hydroxy-6-metoxy-1,4-benzoquinol methylase
VLARALARRGAHATGIDISRPLLDLARRKEAEAPLGVTKLNGIYCGPRKR